MTLKESFKAKAIIHAVALKENQSVEHVRKEMQEALDAAWEAAWAPGNIRGQVAWQRLFPGGRKPTVEEFIIGISDKKGTKN